MRRIEHPFARIDENGEIDQTFFRIDFRGGVDVGKGITFGAQAIGNGFGGLIELLAREHPPGRTLTNLRRSASGIEVSPANLIEATRNRSPSLMLRVMKTSRLSGEMETHVDSTLNSR